jgi:2-polyprenyl-3-methyl-5-hydroxy-6-metoxy-1,4-benzoquinol methylase
MDPRMNKNVLKSIKSVYRQKTTADIFEKIYIRCKERIAGLDYSVFDKTILYYEKEKNEKVSYEQALKRALDKRKHKDSWYLKERSSAEAYMQFYEEVDIYPFMQPYLRRFGGWRWYTRLVKHIDKPSILEYGAGSAVLTEYLIEKCPGFNYTIADIPSATLDFVKWKKREFNYPYNILTIGSGKDGIPLREDFDLIICKNVLEHTPNPLEIIQAFIEHLSPGGVLLVDFFSGAGGENLQEASDQREAVKQILKENLISLKVIDENKRNDGLYVKPVVE